MTTSTNVAIGHTNLKGLFFGFGVDFKLNPFQLNVESTHSWMENKGSKDSTAVSVTLGDDDPGDEFVVDMKLDKRYGSLVFETIAGRSKCPWEAKTLPQEDPSIEITRFPSQFVFPDDEMIFELEFKNLGVGDASLFALYAQLNDDEGNMEILVDGSPLFESRVYFSVLREVPIKKTLTIKRGPRMFVNKPIPLTFESACMDDASL